MAVRCCRLRPIGLAAVIGVALAPAARAEDPLLAEAVNFAGAIAYYGSGVPAFVLAAVRDGETAFAGFGEIAEGTGEEPTGDTLMRIGSISKAFCGDVLASLIADGTLGLTDPLAAHLGPDFPEPEMGGRRLRIVDLATQSSGLPREVPQEGGTADDPFRGNTREAQIAGLAADPLLFPPGTGVLYSNWGFDLLGMALAGAGGKPYAALLEERVLAPRDMADTVFEPRPEHEANLMQGHFFDGTPMPWVPTPETIECAGGLYTTANDMLKWLAWQLDREDEADAEWRRIEHAGWLWRDGLSPVSGLDESGPMAAMALGWVVLAPEGDRPLILNKTGGLQGMFAYAAIAPAHGIGVFTAINQFSLGGSALMIETAHRLISELAPR